MDQESVKKRILKTRKDRNLSQQEMADRMGMTRNSYRALESGKTRIYSEHIERFAEITGLSEEEVLLGYRPLEEKDLSDVRASYESRIRSEREEFQRQIDELREKMATMADTIELQRETIKSQSTTIKYLDKNSEND